jgi:hypothetical protein
MPADSERKQLKNRLSW